MIKISPSLNGWTSGLLKLGDSIGSEALPQSTILIAGDFFPDWSPTDELCDTADPLASLKPILANVRYSIVNLEYPFQSQGEPIEKSGPHLVGHPAWASYLSQVGFSAVSLANNHIRDFGALGIKETISHCVANKLDVVGAGTSQNDIVKPLSVSLSGHRVALVGICENEFSTSRAGEAGANGLDVIRAHDQIQKARASHDSVVVIFHGGTEHRVLPSPRVAKLARFFIDVGAHAVVCHHTHVPSGFLIHHGAPIIFGTGNLLARGSKQRSPYWYRGLLVALDFGPAAKGFQPLAVRLFPYSQCDHSLGVAPLNETEATDLLTDLDGLASTIADERRMESAWSDYCRSKTNEYLACLLSLGRVESRLLRMGIFPFWRTTRKRLVRLLNVLRCEAHHEVLSDSLRSFLEPNPEYSAGLNIARIAGRSIPKPSRSS